MVLSLLGCDNGGNDQTDCDSQQEQALTVPDNLDHPDSILGTDADNNNVRDDLDQWIDQQNITEPQRKALKQSARAYQYQLAIDYSDPIALSFGGVKMAHGRYLHLGYF